MNEILDQDFEEPSEYNGNLFVGVLTNPRAVFRYLHTNAHDQYVWLLLFFSGIVGHIDPSIFFFYGGFFQFLQNILKAVFLGGVLAIVLNYLYSILLRWIGSFLNGTVETKDILRVVAYSMIPTFFGIIISVFQFFIIRNFSSGVDVLATSDTTMIVGQIIIIISILITVIWPIALIVIGLSEIQKWSLGKAFLAVFLSILVIVLIGVFAFVGTDLFYGPFF